MTRQAPTLLALALLSLAACRRSPPEIASCADPLSGVWRDPSGRGFHILDRGNEVDVFPMWDTTAPGNGLPGATDPKPMLISDPGAPDAGAPVRSPVRILLRERTPEAVAGGISVRIGRCTVASGATLSGCRGRSAQLILQEEPTVNLLTCAPSQPSNRSITVPLHRE